MGMKRKASALYDEPNSHSLIGFPFDHDALPTYLPTGPNTSQPPSSPPSMTSTSTLSSPSSMTTEPYQAQSRSQNITDPSTFQQWNQDLHGEYNKQAQQFESLPAWINVRTRKRVRDNRPSEDQVSDKTVERLFAAAREGRDCGADLPVETDGSDDDEEEQEPDALSCGHIFHIGMPQEAERGQKSIHDFFGGQPLPHSRADEIVLQDEETMDVDTLMNVSMNTPNENSEAGLFHKLGEQSNKIDNIFSPCTIWGHG